MLKICRKLAGFLARIITANFAALSVILASLGSCRS